MPFIQEFVFEAEDLVICRSIFGEDALANLSIEKSVENPNAPVIGHIRIRAKSQVSNFWVDSKFLASIAPIQGVPL